MIARTALFSLALVGLLVAGCFGSRAAPPEPSATPTVAEAAEPSANQEAASTNTPAGAQPSATAPEEATNFIAIEDAPSISSYRLRVAVQAETARGNDDIQVMGEYTKEPPAEQLVIDIQDRNGEAHTMQMLRSDDLFYMQAGDAWVQAPGDRLGLREITLIEPADAAAVGAQFERVGEETINGRTTVHYRGGPEAVPVGGTPGDTFDVTEIESAQIDLWIDQAENFIMRMEIRVEGDQSDPDARYFMSFEYYDLNADIDIEIPDIAVGAQPPATAATAMPTTAAADALPNPQDEPTGAENDLSALGLDLSLPSDATILLAAPNMVQFSTALSVEEAANFFEQKAQENGYTQVNHTGTVGGDMVSLYQVGAQLLTLSFSPGETGTEVTAVAAP